MSTDLESIAQALYSRTTPPTAPEASATSPPTAGPADPWSGNPKDIEHFGDDYVRPTEMFSPEIASRAVMQQHQNTLRDVVGLDQARYLAFNRAHVAMLRETGLDAGGVGEKLYATHVEALVAGARGTESDGDRQQAMEETIRRELREQYGVARAERLQRAVGEFVQGHPQLRQLIGIEGFRAQPSAKQAFDALIEHVRQVKQI